MMRLPSAVVTRSLTRCGLPKTGSCSRRRCPATAAYSGDSRRSLCIVRDDLMHHAGAAISQRPGQRRSGRPVLFASGRTSLADSAWTQLREWRLGGFLVGELEREFYPAVAGGTVGGVDDFKDRAAVFAGLTGNRVLSDAAREVVHLLRVAAIPQLVGHREGPSAGVRGLFHGISVTHVAECGE